MYDYDKAHEELEMLKGNLNRMMITDDIEELFDHYDVAKTRLGKIYQANVDRLKEK